MYTHKTYKGGGGRRRGSKISPVTGVQTYKISAGKNPRFHEQQAFRHTRSRRREHERKACRLIGIQTYKIQAGGGGREEKGVAGTFP